MAYILIYKPDWGIGGWGAITDGSGGGGGGGGAGGMLFAGW